MILVLLLVTTVVSGFPRRIWPRVPRQTLQPPMLLPQAYYNHYTNYRPANGQVLEEISSEDAYQLAGAIPLQDDILPKQSIYQRGPSEQLRPVPAPVQEADESEEEKEEEEDKKEETREEEEELSPTNGEYVDFGAHTGDNGAFGWYADYPANYYQQQQR